MNLDATLVDEVLWLKKMKERLREVGEGHVEEALIEGHLGITKELVSFMPPERKFQLGSDESEGINLIKVGQISIFVSLFSLPSRISWYFKFVTKKELWFKS